MLSDDVLLEMFTFYVDKVLRADDWHTLIHVCRRWRTIVLASPRRLNLQLLCTSRRPMRQIPDVWLALPIVVSDAHDAMNDTDSILAALEHTDCVREIVLENVSNQLLEEFAALPPDPFPVLTCLRLRSIYESPPVLPFWVHLPHVYDTSTSMAFHFRQYRNCLFPPMTLLLLNFGTFRIPDIFRPRQWSVACPP
jgi:hypothetical protein